MIRTFFKNILYAFPYAVLKEMTFWFLFFWAEHFTHNYLYCTQQCLSQHSSFCIVILLLHPVVQLHFVTFFSFPMYYTNLYLIIPSIFLSTLNFTICGSLIFSLFLPARETFSVSLE